MGKVVERKKKKKGRPSLLDLQKRTLKEEQQQQKQHQNKRNISAHHSPNNYHSATPLLLRRSTRRNPNPSEEEPEDDEESSGRRREKKLKLVLKLPSEKSPNTSAASLNSSDSNADSSSNQRKRKINAIADGSEVANSAKGEKPVFGTNPTNNAQGTQLDSGPSTPLPDKKLLLFILDRLQKKDTYGVFSEPVDPNELPDYHEVIEHPMDFGTVRNKLASGTYANLEQFERDVYLICSNAMQYNAPDTIYFRQARSIQELAKKNFENLRQDSDDNEPEPKVIRRGRPPSRNLKKQLGRHLQERAGSEFSSDAALANGIENTIWPHHDPKRGPLSSDKTGFSDSSGRLLPRDVYSSWLAENKLERSDEGSILKGYSMKHAKRQFVLDGNRRNTYKQYHPSAGGQEPSVLTTFDGERKQLMTVGLLTEHGYARSLARFAANLGPVAWNVAARKMEKCLPPGIKFGPGWVGENDLFPQKPLPSLPHPAQLSSSQKFSVAETSCSAASPCTLESRDKVLEKSEGVNSGEKHVPLLHSAMDGYLSKPLTPSAITSSSSVFPARGSPEPCTEVETTTGGLNSHSGLNMLNSNVGIVRPRPPFQIHPGMNGFNGTYGISIPAQMGKLMGTTKSGGFSFQRCQVVDTPSRTNNNSVHPGAMNNLNLEDSKLSENPSTITSSGPLTNSECEASAASKSGLHPQPAWEVLSSQLPPDCRLLPELKPDSVPPDLNVRFQSPGSPSSSRVDSTQPHLALQL